MDASSQDRQLTHRQFVLEVPSYLAHPLAPSLAAEPMSGSSLDESVYPTWILFPTELLAVLDSLWELLEPETEKIIGNAELLPIVQNSAQLPYRDFDQKETLFIQNLPECLIPRPKLGGNVLIPCFLCGEEMKLNKMCNHVTPFHL
jgi:hypothetical protein